MALSPEQTERLAQLALACAKPLRARIVAALSRRGVGQVVTLADLALLLADDPEGMPNTGPLLNELKILKKNGILFLEKAGSQPSNYTCAIKEDGVFGELADLAEQAQRDTQAQEHL